MTTHIVTKRLFTDGKTFEPGSEVDASKWRNKTLLEEQRYIRPIQAHEREMRRKQQNG